MEIENKTTTDFFSIEAIDNLSIDNGLLDFDLGLNLQFDLFTKEGLNENNEQTNTHNDHNKEILNDNFENDHQHFFNNKSLVGETKNNDFLTMKFEKLSSESLIGQEPNSTKFNQLNDLNELGGLEESVEFKELNKLLETIVPFDPIDQIKNNHQTHSTPGLITNPTEHFATTPSTTPRTFPINPKTTSTPIPNIKIEIETENETETKTQTKTQTGTETKIKSETETETKTKETKDKGLIRTKRQSNRRKRIQEKCRLKKINSITVESGKELFKFLTGLLWVISHGASTKQLKPYTTELSNKLTSTLKASLEEKKIFSTQLKNLLSNSRRTFSEFIMEIMVGVLSLNYKTNNEAPKISIKYGKLLKALSTFENFHTIPIPQQEKFKKKLEKMYSHIFNERLLNFWFEKRFTDRPEHLYTNEIKTQFFEKHLYFFGKIKFQLLSIVLSKQLLKCQKIIKNYSDLIELDFNQDAFNCYCNNRGKKLKLIKSIVSKFGLNSSKYWAQMTKQSIKNFPFAVKDMFQHFPFKDILLNHQSKSKNPNFRDLIPAKKRNLATIEQKKDSDIEINWFFK
ncbi:hypothetical protein M0812_10761 [Anaeramoeba flamelloides]|uniref:Uncharacterized protein n=1 Tax=Anaeramoeba flamelloides TaxID=1746091 RepID=A0AAV7ZSI2_9EUKA|nr:hypothetical protein M0812_10761 [Anaeramoeba flamelloides]